MEIRIWGISGILGIWGIWGILGILGIGTLFGVMWMSGLFDARILLRLSSVGSPQAIPPQHCRAHMQERGSQTLCIVPSSRLPSIQDAL